MASAMKKKKNKSHVPGISLVRNRSSTVYNVVFTNRKMFPSFLELPNEKYPTPINYRPAMFADIVPIRPWFFLGEITDARYAQSQWMRHRIYVRDIDGKQPINIDFYLNSDSENTFDYSQLKVGHTICINFGSQHFFLDGTHGIRVENYKKVQVFPAALSSLMTTVSDEIKENIPLHQKEKPSQAECLTYVVAGKADLLEKYLPLPQHCWHCKKTESDELKLKRCAKCCLATYCEKSCQIEHWNKSHKVNCKCLKLYTPMVNGMKTALNNLSQHLLDTVSTDEEEDDENKDNSDDSNEINDDDDDDDDYYCHSSSNKDDNENEIANENENTAV